MAKDDDEARSAPVPPKKRATPSVITLQASEIPPESTTAPATEPAATVPQVAPSDAGAPSPEAVTKPVDEAAAAAPTVSDQPKAEPPKLEPAGAEPLGAEPLGAEPRSEPAPVIAPPPPSGPGFAKLGIAALIGGALVGGAGYGAASFGFWPTPSPNVAPLEARIAELDRRLAAVAARPTPPTPAPAAPVDLGPLAARIAALEGRPTPAPAGVDIAPLATRLERLERRESVDVQPLAQRLAALEQRPAATPEAAPAADLAPLRAEIEAVKAAVSAAVAAAAQPAPTAGPDTGAVRSLVAEATASLAGRLGEAETRLAAAARAADEAAAPARQALAATEELRTALRGVERGGAALVARLAKVEATDAGAGMRLVAKALAVQSLNSAVERGQPYTKELAALRAQDPQTPALAALSPFAERGLPTIAGLTRQLAAVAPQIVKAAAPPPAPQAETGLLDRLAANAQSLVRVRALGEASGGDAGAAVSRAEAALSLGDLAAAVAALDVLPPQAKAAAEPFAAGARGRLAATEALRTLTESTLSALAPRQ